MGFFMIPFGHFAFCFLAIEIVGEVPKGKDLANQFKFCDFPRLPILLRSFL